MFNPDAAIEQRIAQAETGLDLQAAPCWQNSSRGNTSTFGMGSPFVSGGYARLGAKHLQKALRKLRMKILVEMDVAAEITMETRNLQFADILARQQSAEF